MDGLPVPLLIVCGTSAGLVVTSFFLAGIHHDIKWRLKQRRYRGYLR